MTARTTCHRLQVATVLHRFIEEQVLPGTGIDSAAFWKGFDAIAHDLTPKNAALLAERDRLQTLLDQWHTAHPAPITDMTAYRDYLSSIGYLVPPPPPTSTPSLHCKPVPSWWCQSSTHATHSMPPMHAGAHSMTPYTAQT